MNAENTDQENLAPRNPYLCWGCRKQIEFQGYCQGCNRINSALNEQIKQDNYNGNHGSQAR